MVSEAYNKHKINLIRLFVYLAVFCNERLEHLLLPSSNNLPILKDSIFPDNVSPLMKYIDENALHVHI